MLQLCYQGDDAQHLLCEAWLPLTLVSKYVRKKTNLAPSRSPLSCIYSTGRYDVFLYVQECHNTHKYTTMSAPMARIQYTSSHEWVFFGRRMADDISNRSNSCGRNCPRTTTKELISFTPVHPSRVHGFLSRSRFSMFFDREMNPFPKRSFLHVMLV